MKRGKKTEITSQQGWGPHDRIREGNLVIYLDLIQSLNDISLQVIKILYTKAEPNKVVLYTILKSLCLRQIPVHKKKIQ